MTETFLKYLKYEKRLSPHTLLAYQTDLNQFCDFLFRTFEEKDSSTATYTMVRSWVVSLVETGIEPQSVNRKIATLRSYFKFLLRQNVIQTDPMIKIHVLKTSKRLPSFVKESDMVQLLDNGEFTDDFAGHRDKLILELFYSTGMRLSELITLKENQVDLSSRTIKVIGKRNKERIIPFPESIVDIIKVYQQVKNKEIARCEHGRLLVTESGTPCYPMLIYRVVKSRLTASTSVERRSPHILRHTYATHLLNKGAEINAVKDLLGHSSLAATQVYTHNSIEKLKKVFEQAHPKA